MQKGLTRILSIVLSCMLVVALLPVSALADGDDTQMFSMEAPLHDYSGALADDELYDAGSYRLQASMEDLDSYTILAGNLRRHQNYNGEMGYWAGIAVAAPDDATQVRMASAPEGEVSLADVEPVALTMDVSGQGDLGVLLLADVSAVTQMHFALQWLNGSGEVLTYTNEVLDGDEIYYFNLDFTGVTLYQEEATLPFTDVAAGDWYLEAVTFVYENGVMNGTSDTTFEPNTTLNRAMMAQILYNMEDMPSVSGESVFTDVPADAWYADAILWASANEIVSGNGDGTFAPENPITREQMALILYRYAQYKEYDTTQGGMSTEEFTDHTEISDWALPAVEWAVNAQLLSGKGDGILDPAGTAIRAEVAQILLNFSEHVAQ